MAKPKYNPKIMKKLLKVLVENPEGIWLSKLAKLAGVPKSTTAFYINNQLRDLIEEYTFGEERNIIRVISLKQSVLEYLKQGKSLNQIIRLLHIIHRD